MDYKAIAEFVGAVFGHLGSMAVPDDGAQEFTIHNRGIYACVVFQHHSPTTALDVVTGVVGPAGGTQNGFDMRQITDRAAGVAVVLRLVFE